MSPHFERGVYQPGEDVRVFDGTEDDEDVEGSRLPLLIVLALLVLAMFGGVVWLAYTQGVARGRTETPVITAANGPARIAPANPGGADQPYKGFKIYEQPAPPDDDTGTTSASTAAAPAPAASTPAPVVPVTKAAPPAATPVAKVAPPPAAKPAITSPSPSPAAARPAPAAMASAAKPAIPAPAPVAKSASVAAPAAQPAPLAIGPATAPPRSLASATAPAPAAAKPVAAPAAATGSSVLQIGAYKSESDAMAAWTAYKAKHAALLSGYGPNVQQADLGEKGVWYRLRITGFASPELATALCDRLKSDGGACFLGK